jgi:hypothetical protein
MGRAGRTAMKKKQSFVDHKTHADEMGSIITQLMNLSNDAKTLAHALDPKDGRQLDRYEKDMIRQSYIPMLDDLGHMIKVDTICAAPQQRIEEHLQELSRITEMLNNL